MDVYVYRSEKKTGYYLYLLEKDNFTCVPQALIDALGSLTLALEFTLDANRTLAREDPETVMKNLLENGFHLQINDQLLTEQALKLNPNFLN
ncbi:hypothetical protein AB833_11155 [Chromatiales bacterium (ex Bugula neritina AB1)]|nr:hypothetical protein AB833_11155 [Chromatiales bacterium (ex Bugula neritina AB1)]